MLCQGLLMLLQIQEMTRSFCTQLPQAHGHRVVVLYMMVSSDLFFPTEGIALQGFRDACPLLGLCEVVQEAKGDLLPSTNHIASCLGLLLVMATLFIHSFQMGRGPVLENKQCSFPFKNHKILTVTCIMHFHPLQKWHKTQNSIIFLFLKKHKLWKVKPSS